MTKKWTIYFYRRLYLKPNDYDDGLMPENDFSFDPANRRAAAEKKWYNENFEGNYYDDEVPEDDFDMPAWENQWKMDDKRSPDWDRPRFTVEKSRNDDDQMPEWANEAFEEKYDDFGRNDYQYENKKPKRFRRRSVNVQW